jgi:hypothetical protein
MTYKIHRDDETKEFDDEGEFRDMCEMLDTANQDYTTTEPEASTDGGKEDVDAPAEASRDESPTGVANPDSIQTEPDIDALVQNPINWLENKNTDYVNTVKGTPAISKRGFRYIQSQFGITTKSEVVTTFDDPVGVVVWAKAELPDGRSAEAHGEGYVTERKVDDNEFVRYADTRAKNRALADLTSSGALCVEEMEGEL